MVDKKKKVGYYASRGKCLRVYSLKKMNKRTHRKTIKKVNSAGKVLKKGTKVFKTKSACKRYINRRKRSPVRRRRRHSPVRRRRRHSPVRRRRRNRFGAASGCNNCGEYMVPYMGSMVPRISELWSGSCDNKISSRAWAVPGGVPFAEKLNVQQGRIYPN